MRTTCVKSLLRWVAGRNLSSSDDKCAKVRTEMEAYDERLRTDLAADAQRARAEEITFLV
jgi:hypothetical protein